jgi:hypothetical protein
MSVFWIIAGVVVLLVAAYAVYEFLWGDCDCEGCEYMRQQQEHDFQKERDWQNR